MSRNNISVIYVTEALRHAQGLGADVAGILDQAGIDPALLADPQAQVGDLQYVAVMLAVMRLSNDEFLGAGGRRRAPRGSFGMMCHAVIHLPILRKALLRAIMFYNMQMGDIHFKLHVEGEKAVLSIRWDDPALDASHVTTEAILTIFQRFASWLIDQRIPLIEATFDYPAPDHVEQYHRLFHCPLRFSQARNSIVFDARYLNYPLMQSEKSLKGFLRAAPANLFVLPHNTQVLSSQIRALIGKDFTQEFPDFEDVSARLNMTPQTLRRRLKDEATSYQAIKDNLRRDAAIYYLSRPQLSISDIAQMMGFSEPSTFHRAFKKWTGLTPGEYRQGLNI